MIKYSAASLVSRNDSLWVRLAYTWVSSASSTTGNMGYLYIPATLVFVLPRVGLILPEVGHIHAVDYSPKEVELRNRNCILSGRPTNAADE